MTVIFLLVFLATYSIGMTILNAALLAKIRKMNLDHLIEVTGLRQNPVFQPNHVPGCLGNHYGDCAVSGIAWGPARAVSPENEKRP